MKKIDSGSQLFAQKALCRLQQFNHFLCFFALRGHMNANRYLFHVRRNLNVGHLDPGQARVFEFVSNHFGELKADRLGHPFVAAAFHNYII